MIVKPNTDMNMGGDMTEEIFYFCASKIRIIELPNGKEIWDYSGDVVELRLDK